MLISCPHCNTGLDITPEYYGQTVQCPACSGRLDIPDAPAEPETTSLGKTIPEREGWAEKDHSNPNFLLGLGIGLGATLLFLGIMYPLKSTPIGAIFVDRGWVNWAETFLFFWGITILVLKGMLNAQQRKAALINLFPENLGKEVTANNVALFIDNIYAVPAALRDSIIVNRIRKALELFEIRNDNNEVSDFLTTQSDIDANKSNGSYSLLKVFLWAIPILGFIGTVMGLSTAVGSLSLDPNNPDGMKESLSALTGGLGTAFDTTLLGLFLSLLLNFPMAMIQKREDETLTVVDTFCTEKLLPKLNDSKASSNDEILQQANSLPELVGSLSRAHATFLENLNQTTHHISETNQMLTSTMISHQQQMEQQLGASIDKLTQTSVDIFLRADNELNSTFKKLSVGTDVLNENLRKIGAEQLDVKPKKKGLFGR